MVQKKDLLRNIFIIAVGRISTQLISLFLLPLYTHFLLPRDYGLVDLVVTYVALIVPLISIQMEMAVFRFLLDARNDDKEKSRVITNALKIAGALYILILIPFLTASLFISIPYVGLLSALVGFTILSNLLLQIARGLGKSKMYALASILTGFTTLVVSITTVAVLKLGANGVLSSLIAANAICSIYLVYSLKLHEYIELKSNDKKLQKKLIHYALPLIPNGISWWVINVSDRTIVTIFIGLTANGLYAVANKYVSIYASIFAIFSMALTESASLHINADDKDKFLSEISNLSVKLFSSLGLILIVLSPYIFTLFVGEKFRYSLQYVPILILAGLFNSLVGIYSAVYIAKKLTKKVAITSISAAFINLVLTLASVKYIGVYGAAGATAIAFLTMAIIRHYDVKKYVTIKYEQNLLVKVAVIYALIVMMFYMRIPELDAFNVLVTAVAIYLLNKGILKSGSKLILSYIGKFRKVS